MLTSARPSLVETLVISLGVLTLIGLYLRSRAILARRHGERTHHFTWPPALALGVALTAFGLAFAPIPATVPPRRPALRWIAPAALAAAAGALLFLGWYSGVPATRAQGVSALVMVGSVLVPARPLDGAYLTNKVASILVTLAMVGASVLLLLGWV